MGTPIFKLEKNSAFSLFLGEILVGSIIVIVSWAFGK